MGCVGAHARNSSTTKHDCAHWVPRLLHHPQQPSFLPLTGMGWRGARTMVCVLSREPGLGVGQETGLAFKVFEDPCAPRLTSQAMPLRRGGRNEQVKKPD